MIADESDSTVDAIGFGGEELDAPLDFFIFPFIGWWDAGILPDWYLSGVLERMNRVTSSLACPLWCLLGDNWRSCRNLRGIIRDHMFQSQVLKVVC